MRSMTFRSDPFRSLFEERLQPYKGMQGHPRMIESGTREEPAIVTRGEWVERKYKAWQEEDGSYHEELIVEEAPNGKEAK